MEIFELLRKHLAFYGFVISQKSPKTHSFNARNSTIFILLCALVISTIASLTDANTYDEYTDILYLGVSIGVCCFVHIILVWKTSELTEFINSVSEIVTESEIKLKF